MIVLRRDQNGELAVAGLTPAAPTGSKLGAYLVETVLRVGAPVRAFVLRAGQDPRGLPGFRPIGLAAA